MSIDRRRVERLRLQEALSGKVGEVPIALIEIGLLGALIEHSASLKVGTAAPLVFSWDEEELQIESRILRSEMQPVLSQQAQITIYHSAIEFAATSGRSGNLLRRMIGSFVTRELEQQKANARGELAPFVDRVPFLSTSAADEEGEDEGTLPSFREEKEKVFLCCHLQPDGVWWRKQVARPKQPVDGFTVSVPTSDSEVELLCKAYEEADEEGRKMIRICAELAISSSDEPIPARTFAL